MADKMVILHNYFRSSTSFRVRAALNLKGIAYEQETWHLRENQQRSSAYLAVNPQGLVPSLVWSDGTVITQSMAIMEFLDEVVAEPALLPADPAGRARVRALTQLIGCEIHPLNNLRVLRHIEQEFGADSQTQADWFRHWVRASFDPLEEMLSSSPDTGDFCHGNRPGMADITLAAQLVNNRRFELNVESWPTIHRIGLACFAHDAFDKALPGNQPDAE